MSNASSARPLDGFRVLEVGQLLAGPFVGSVLGYYGAEVIKVEAPGDGDPIRKWRILDEDGTSYWWRSLGARTQVMDAQAHDEVYALTSHLPHLLAFAYLQRVEPAHLDHAGGGFRDFSRIGGSDPQMWSAIFGLNKDALLQALDGFESDLATLRDAIASEDVAALRRLIGGARKRRQHYSND